MDGRAAGYFKELNGLLLRLEATDRQGLSLGLEEGIARAVGLLLSARTAGRKVMLAGNGGSAATASHLHDDLAAGVRVRAMVFHDPPLLTALANDFGYETVFETPARWWAEPGDLFIGISSSGRSQNIIRAARVCGELGCSVVTFTGFDPDNPLRGMGDVNFYIPARHVGFVEVGHAVVAHCLTDGVLQASEARP